MKPKLSTLKRKADKLFSQEGRKIGACCFCGSTGHLNSHHIISKRHTPLRWNLRNSLCLCCSCHKFNIAYSAHNNPWVVMEWLEEHRPEDIEYLKEMAKQPIVKLTIEDMEKIILKI